MQSPEYFPFLTILTAIILAVIATWGLRQLGKLKVLKNYLPETVITFVTIGILIYVLCIWVVGAILTWVTTAHVSL